ncbi:MAG: hypothetical protein WEG56_04315 [Chloroflexota bacterium]
MIVAVGEGRLEKRRQRRVRVDAGPNELPADQRFLGGVPASPYDQSEACPPRAARTVTKRSRMAGDRQMALALAGNQTVAWARPPRCAAGLAPVSVTIGEDPAGMGLEVAQTDWTGAGTPSREALASLHAARLNKRLCPVVVVALDVDDGDVWAFGPNPQGQVVGPFAAEQAARLFQAALDQASGLLARQRLSALYDALDGTAMPGVANAGLFASNDLRKGVRQRPDWLAASERAKSMLALRRDALIKKLGFTTERSGGHALVLATHAPQPRAVAVLLQDTEGFDAESARFAVSPIAYGLAVATRLGIPWLIVARGSQIRLYPAKPDVGVGRKGQAETYFELDLALLTDDTAGFLPLVFSDTALDEGGTAEQILGSSAQYAVGLGERLRTKVYDQIVPNLSLAIANQLRTLGHAMDRSGLDLAYQLTLRTFFRLLFQAYAEDRKLLPYGENPRYDRNALNTVANDLTENPDQPFDAESTSLWDDLVQVWRVIDKGDSAWSVPAYNGGLFSTDPELHPEGALLAKVAITNNVLGPALRALLIDTDDDDTTGPIDFRSLSVREFGTIYEGLLESNLALADVDLTLGMDDTWLPANDADEVVAPAGTVYFHNTSGQRKGTGSYFTPSFVVEHLLERALDPALDAHLTRIAALLERDDTASAARDFFDFRVADLAMGSAHFLTAAIDHIEAKMAAFLADHDIPGVTQELRHLDEAARAAVGPDAPEPEPSSLLRRQIARRCIYGLDINPVSVELARVSVWIHTFVRGLPMSSLDHNLVCANSLTGIGSVDEALDVLVEGRKGNQLTVFDAPIKDALDAARDVLTDVAAAAEATRPEAEAAARAAQRARIEAETAKLLFDAAVLKRIGRDDLRAASEPDKIVALAAEPSAQEAVSDLNPAHFPYLFPEVFLRDRPGFDVLIGNPPWEKLKVEEHQWWWLRFPGLRALPVAERSARIAALRGERPDLQAEFEREVEASEASRRVLINGPYPGIGAGHVDLYKAFAWRNWQLLALSGRLGVVLPRAALTGAGTERWRREVLTSGTFADVCVITNTGHWVFHGVDGRYTVAFVVGLRDPAAEELALSGPFHTYEGFISGRDHVARVTHDEFLGWTTSATFPLLRDDASARIFRQMRLCPEFRSGSFRPVIELRPVEDRTRIDTDFSRSTDPIPVFTGGTFNLWDPDFGKPYGFSKADVLEYLLEKTQRSSHLAKSPFSGLTFSKVEELPSARPRVAFRDVTKYDNTRTVIAALVPPRVLVMHACPYLLRTNADEQDEAFVLGVLSSVPFDWYARRVVELHVTFDLLGSMPIPAPGRNDSRRLRVIEIAGRLAAVDDRYSKWALAAGVPVGSVSEVEKPNLIAELDALVAHLYELDRVDVVHIFESFHRGWDYRPRLEQVLSSFDSIDGGA